MTSRIVEASFVAAEFLATIPPLAAQALQLQGNNDPKSGLPTATLESGIDVQIFTAVDVPAKNYAALTGSQGHFPVMVLSASRALRVELSWTGQLAEWGLCGGDR